MYCHDSKGFNPDNFSKESINMQYTECVDVYLKYVNFWDFFGSKLERKHCSQGSS